jgi:hypothetical protein
MTTSLNGANADRAHTDRAHTDRAHTDRAHTDRAHTDRTDIDSADTSGADTVEGVLRRQAGVVSRAQALTAGATAREIDRLVARRRWVPVHPRVYLAATYGFTAEARVRAAVLWAGDGAVLGGLAAVWWHGLLPVLTATVTVTVPRRCPAPRPGVAVRRRLLRAGDVVALRGVAVPVRPLALLDAAVEAGAGGAALLRALRGDLDLVSLQAVAEQAVGRASAGRLLADAARRGDGDSL